MLRWSAVHLARGRFFGQFRRISEGHKKSPAGWKIWNLRKWISASGVLGTGVLVTRGAKAEEQRQDDAASDGILESWTASFKKKREELADSFESADKLSDVVRILGSLTSGVKDAGQDKAVVAILEQARTTVDEGAFQSPTSITSLWELFHKDFPEIQAMLKRKFGDLGMENFDPTSLFYYLEYEDERKNPSWKCRMHRYMKGVSVEEVKAMRDALVLSDISYADSVKEIKSGLELLTDGQAELVACSLDSRPGKPGHFVAVSKGGRKGDEVHVMVVVRGTKTIEDAFTDAMLDATEYRDGLVHAGILRSGQWLADQHEQRLRDLEDAVGSKKLKVHSIGHSLGAGSATILGMELRERGFDVEVVGFGCPALLSKKLSESCHDFVTTVICDSDCVPRMSAATLANLALDVLEFDWTDRALRDAKELVGQLKRLNAAAPFPLSDADLACIISKIDDAITARLKPKIKAATTDRIEVVLYPPGRCCHVYRDGRGVSAAYAPCDFFNEIEVNRRMVDDHVMTGYDAVFMMLTGTGLEIDKPTEGKKQ